MYWNQGTYVQNRVHRVLDTPAALQHAPRIAREATAGTFGLAGAWSCPRTHAMLIDVDDIEEAELRRLERGRLRLVRT